MSFFLLFWFSFISSSFFLCWIILYVCNLHVVVRDCIAQTGCLNSGARCLSCEWGSEADSVYRRELSSNRSTAPSARRTKPPLIHRNGDTKKSSLCLIRIIWTDYESQNDTNPDLLSLSIDKKKMKYEKKTKVVEDCKHLSEALRAVNILDIRCLWQREGQRDVQRDVQRFEENTQEGAAVSLSSNY